MVSSFNKGNGCPFTLILFMVKVNYSVPVTSALWYYSWLRLTTVYLSLLHFDKWWRTQHDTAFFFASRWYLYRFSKQCNHQNDRRQPARLPTPPHFQQWFHEMNLFVWDDGHPGCRLCSAESWLWQNASTHHMRVWYINPLSLYFPQTTPTVPSTTITYHLYFDPGVIFQVCRHVTAQCYETLTVMFWHMLCVVLQGKTMTAYIWNMVCKLHAAQTGDADCRDLTRALCCLTGQDNDSIYLKHGQQVTRLTNGKRWLSWFDTCSALSYRARQWQHIPETWSASYTPHKRETLTVVIWHMLCVVLQG